jgi:hypothetical protein
MIFEDVEKAANDAAKAAAKADSRKEEVALYVPYVPIIPKLADKVQG